MLRFFSGATHDRSDNTPAVRDPLAAVIDILDEAHRELTVQDLAAVLLEVHQLAAVLGAPPVSSLHPDQAVTRSDPPLLTAAGWAYRRRAASRLCECIDGPHHPGELADLGLRLEDYIEEVAARPTGSAIPA